jgi:hypothetical protein
MTAYVAHAGTPLTIPRIEAVRRDGEILYARTQKKDLFCVPQSHVVALAIEGALRQEPRRAGFG